jgi:TolB protein
MSSNRDSISSRVRVRIAMLLVCCTGVAACHESTATAPASVAVTVPDQPAPPASAPFASGAIPAGRLAFELEVYGTQSGKPGSLPRIYTMRTDGTGLLALTPDGEIGRAPAWSPDGSRLAYESYHADAAEVWTVRSDGTGRALVARAATDPFWLDDTHLGYQCGTSLCAVRDDGSQQRTLLARDSLPNAADFAYRLSPDGRTIAFTRLTYFGPGAPSSHVYVMNVDGTGERMLMEGDSPQWSPVGRSIAFASANYGTAVADVDGGVVTSVSKRDGVSLPGGVSNPGWSPAGTELVFGSGLAFYFARADGTGPIGRGYVPISIDADRGYTVNAWAWTSP